MHDPFDQGPITDFLDQVGAIVADLPAAVGDQVVAKVTELLHATAGGLAGDGSVGIEAIVAELGGPEEAVAEALADLPEWPHRRTPIRTAMIVGAVGVVAAGGLAVGILTAVTQSTGPTPAHPGSYQPVTNHVDQHR